MANQMKLTDVPGHAEFTGMFDQYKMCGIARKWVFSKTSAEIGTSAEVPNLLTINDFNDYTALASEAEMLQIPSYKASLIAIEFSTEAAISVSPSIIDFAILW